MSIRRVTTCPYCRRVVAVDVGCGAVVFDPDRDGGPCPHVVFVHGHCACWGASPSSAGGPGYATFGWDHPAADRPGAEQLPLVAVRTVVRRTPAGLPEHQSHRWSMRQERRPDREEASGYSTGGWAVFAEDATAFLVALARLATREVAGGEQD